MPFCPPSSSLFSTLCSLLSPPIDPHCFCHPRARASRFFSITFSASLLTHCSLLSPLSSLIFTFYALRFSSPFSLLPSPLSLITSYFLLLHPLSSLLFTFYVLRFTFPFCFLFFPYLLRLLLLSLPLCTLVYFEYFVLNLFLLKKPS